MSFKRFSLNRLDKMIFMSSVPLMTLLLIFGALFFAFWTPNLSYVELLQPGTEDQLVPPPRAASNFTSTENNSTCNPNGTSC